MNVLLLLILLWSLVEVHSQTVPYVSFMGENLPNHAGVYLSLNGVSIPNHGYVVISDIGSTDGTALLCNTNHLLVAGSANSRGNWFGPDGSTVGSISTVGSADFGRTRGPGLVRLIRNSDATGTPTEGIYSCIIQDDTLTLQTVYVGLYNSGGGLFFQRLLI